MTIIPLLRHFWLPLLLLVLAVGLYAVGNINGKNACIRKAEAAQAKAIIAQQEAAKQEQGKVIVISNELADKLDDARTLNKQLEGKLYAERQKRIYSDCVLPNDGVQLYNTSIK